MEIEDGAYPLLRGVVATVDVETAFTQVDVAILVGGFPRLVGFSCFVAVALTHPWSTSSSLRCADSAIVNGLCVGTFFCCFEGFGGVHRLNFWAAKGKPSSLLPAHWSLPCFFV